MYSNAFFIEEIVELQNKSEKIDSFEYMLQIFRNMGFCDIAYFYSRLDFFPGVRNNLMISEVVSIETSMTDGFHHSLAEYNNDELFQSDLHIIPFHFRNETPFLTGLHVAEQDETHLGRIKVDPVRISTLGMLSETMGSANVVFPVMTPETTEIPSGSLTAYSHLRGAELIHAVQWAKFWGRMLSEMFAEQMIKNVKADIIQSMRLTPREHECLQFVASGYRPSEIADRIGIAKATVDFHLTAARGRLRARTLSQAVARAMIFGLIKL